MKAAGPDGIPNEFYKEGGIKIKEGLTNLFVKIIEDTETPEEWSKVAVTLIHKGGNKSKKKIENYRPIAVTNNINNIFCGILKEKIGNIIEENNIIGEEQNGFRKDRRGTENLFILNELIEKAKKENKEYVCAFLDIEKAYDTVSREALWAILRKIGIQENIIKVIEKLYKNTMADFTLGNIKVKGVKSTRGLRQGCTMSPLLFSIFLEELNQRIKKTGLGIKINEDILSLLLFADDAIIVAENLEDLQKMLQEVDRYSKELQINFGANKCKIMILNNKQENGTPRREIKLNGTALEIVKEYKYLGLTIEDSGLSKEKIMTRSKAEKKNAIINSKIHFRANKYEVSRGMWKGWAVPAIMYGMEIIPINQAEQKGLEVVQNKMAKACLGANNYAATQALRGEMGWSSFEERINKAKIGYEIRLEKMNENRWAKKILNWTRDSSKFKAEAKKRRNKEKIKLEIENNEVKIKINDEEIQGCERKITNIIKKQIKMNGLEKWKQEMEEKTSLEIYKNKEKPKQESFYNGSWESSLLFKARTNSLEINERIKKWGEGPEHCQKCVTGGENIPETIKHIITECPAYTEEREKMEKDIEGKIGKEKWKKIKREEKMGVDFILGMHTEENEVINSTKTFLGRMWKERKKNTNRSGPINHIDHTYTENSA